ncbi:MAG TPA: hypothetical protein VGC04_01495 [Cellulomonas sp.]
MTAVAEAREVAAAARAARAALAWEALAHAERRTGARSVRTLPVAARSVVQAADDEPARPALITAERPPMAVPSALEPLLPDGLRRGGTTAVEGSTSLVLVLLAHACAQGAWAAVVGRPDLGVLAASQAGVDLGRLAMVPNPGPDAAAVVAALLDGLDVVVVGPGALLTDADRRRLAARARDRGSVLLPTYAWPGASTTLVAEAGRWAGVGTGDGWLRAHLLRVARVGRGAGAAHTVDLVLPLGAQLPDEAAVASVDEAPAEGLRLVG